MVIRKTFKSETAHCLKNPYSDRCKNLHGHHYLYEVFLQSDICDDGGMVTDFGFVKKYISYVFDSFDHAVVINKNRPEEFKQFFKDNFGRVIITPWESTAELQSLYFYMMCNKVVEYLNKFNLWENGETGVTIRKVRVHETDTGFAEFTAGDYNHFNKNNNVNDMLKVEFTECIQNDWSEEFKQFWKWLKEEQNG